MDSDFNSEKVPNQLFDNFGEKYAGRAGIKQPDVKKLPKPKLFTPQVKSNSTQNVNILQQKKYD